MRLNKKLRELRKKKNWSQEAAAEKCGISLRYYCLLESPRDINPRMNTLKKIASAFGISLANLIK